MDSHKFVAAVHRAMMEAGVDPSKSEVKLQETDWMYLAGGFDRDMVFKAEERLSKGHLIAYGVKFVCAPEQGEEATIVNPAYRDEFFKSFVADYCRPRGKQESNYLHRLNSMTEEERRKLREGDFGETEYQGHTHDFVVLDEAASIPVKVWEENLDLIKKARDVLNSNDVPDDIAFAWTDGAPVQAEPKPCADAFDIAKAMIEGSNK